VTPGLHRGPVGRRRPEPDPWRRLAAAVLLQAVKDAGTQGRHRAEALQWLRTEGLALAMLLDLDAGLQKWLKEASDDG
jgi:hypothetical protein